MIQRSYLELISIDSFEDRLRYLRLNGNVGEDTFGSLRYLNQTFYHSKEWKEVKDKVIIRDNGCDLAHCDHPITDRIYIHHINPITKEDILSRSESLFDLNNLVCVTKRTHDAIHYGGDVPAIKIYKPRTKNDTCPWRT